MNVSDTQVKVGHCSTGLKKLFSRYQTYNSERQELKAVEVCGITALSCERVIQAFLTKEGLKLDHEHFKPEAWHAFDRFARPYILPNHCILHISKKPQSALMTTLMLNDEDDDDSFEVEDTPVMSIDLRVVQSPPVTKRLVVETMKNGNNAVLNSVNKKIKHYKDNALLATKERLKGIELRKAVAVLDEFDRVVVVTKMGHDTFHDFLSSGEEAPRIYDEVRKTTFSDGQCVLTIFFGGSSNAGMWFETTRYPDGEHVQSSTLNQANKAHNDLVKTLNT